MRRFIANNALLFERISNVELKQLEYQKQTDEKLERIFEYISEHVESSQKIFFNGQFFDAFSLLVSLIGKAEKEIMLIDGYVDAGTLDLLSKKSKCFGDSLYTKPYKTYKDGCKKFQCPVSDVRREIHKDISWPILILDQEIAYHIGASLKDAGKKCFGINLIQDVRIVKDILQRLELETEDWLLHTPKA